MFKSIREEIHLERLDQISFQMFFEKNRRLIDYSRQLKELIRIEKKLKKIRPPICQLSLENGYAVGWDVRDGLLECWLEKAGELFMGKPGRLFWGRAYRSRSHLKRYSKKEISILHDNIDNLLQRIMKTIR